MSRNAAPVRAGSDRASLYDEITSKIIAELEAGGVPWVQPWGTASSRKYGALMSCGVPWVQPWGTASAKATLTIPRNAATGRQYAGINVLILWGAVIERGYPAQSWLTFRQGSASAGMSARASARHDRRLCRPVHAG